MPKKRKQQKGAASGKSETVEKKGKVEEYDEKLGEEVMESDEAEESDTDQSSTPGVIYFFKKFCQNGTNTYWLVTQRIFDLYNIRNIRLSVKFFARESSFVVEK